MPLFFPRVRWLLLIFALASSAGIPLRAQTSAPPALQRTFTGDGQTVQTDSADSTTLNNLRRFRQTHLWSTRGGIEAHEMHDIPYDVSGPITAGIHVGYGSLWRCTQDSTTPTAVGKQICAGYAKVSDQSGMSLGNTGGWMTSGVLNLTHFASHAGIVQTLQLQHYRGGVGDSSMVYGYALCAGGTIAPSDEGCAHWSSVGGQFGSYFSGRFPQGVTTGQTIFPDFDSKSGTCYDTSGHGDRYCYGQGEYLIDSSAPIARGNILSATQESNDGPGMMTVEPANLSPVPVWGAISAQADIPKPDSPDLARPSIPLTVSVMRGTGFAAGDAVCFLGNDFPENSTVVSATPFQNKTQTVTLSLRKPHSKGHPHFLFKAPACGQLSPDAEEAQTGWPAGYFALPIDNSHLAWAFYSHGSRWYGAPPFDIKGRNAESRFVLPVQDTAVRLVRAADGTVTASAPGSLQSFAHLPQVRVSGCSEASLNEDFHNASVSSSLNTLTYTSATRTEARCNTARLNVAGANGYSLYYGAEIVSTTNPASPGNGVNGYMEVEQNRIPWQGGHIAKVGHSESFNGSIFRVVQTQLTPGNGWTNSGTILQAGLSGNVSGCAFCIVNHVEASHYAGLGGWQQLPTVVRWQGPVGTLASLSSAPRVMVTAGHALDFPQGSANEPDYQIFSLRGYQADAVLTVSPSAFHSSTKPSWTFSGAGQFQGNLAAANFNGILPATTPAIGGALLQAGACATGSVSVAGALPGQPVAVSASDGTLPQPTILLSAAVVAPNTVTVQLCAVAPTTPPAKAYNVRVIQ